MFGDQVIHHVVEWFEILFLFGRCPGRKGQNVVAGFGLSLSRNGQQVFLTLRGDEVHPDFDFFFLGPFFDQILDGLVGARNPMVPEPDGD